MVVPYMLYYMHFSIGSSTVCCTPRTYKGRWTCPRILNPQVAACLSLLTSTTPCCALVPPAWGSTPYACSMPRVASHMHAAACVLPACAYMYRSVGVNRRRGGGKQAWEAWLVYCFSTLCPLGPGPRAGGYPGGRGGGLRSGL